MNREGLWQYLRKTADTIEFDEAPDLSAIDGFTVEELDGLRAILEPVGRAVRLIQTRTLELMQPALGERGFAKFGDRVYRAAPDRKWSLREETAGEFWQFVRDEDAARRLFNPNDARITGLRDLGDHWFNKETGEVGYSAFEAHFLDVELGAVKVTPLPTNKAPQFIQKAEDGVEHRA